MWLDKVKESIEIITNFRIKKDWSTLEKDDKLFLMIPYDDNGIIKYEFQESHVINIHHYDWCTNIRFKYTDKNINKRQRVEFCVNKTKYDQTYLANDKKTGWARENKIQFGDMIVTYINPELLNDAYTELIQNKISEQEALIKSQKEYLDKLKSIQYNKVV